MTVHWLCVWTVTDAGRDAVDVTDAGRDAVDVTYAGRDAVVDCREL